MTIRIIAYIILLNYCPTPLSAQKKDVTSDVFHANSAGSNEGRIELHMNNGFPPFEFNWTGPNGFSSDQEDIDQLYPGTYEVKIQNALCGHLEMTFKIKYKGSHYIKTRSFEIMSLSPIPFSRDFNIHIRSSQNQILNQQLIGAQGRVIKIKKTKLTVGDNYINWTCLECSNGLYIVQFCDEQGCVASEPIIRSHNY